MIGVFDSGFGGLAILKEVRKKLPQYDYLYVGDSARAPYGPRPREEVYTYTLEAVKYLMDRGCELVLIACNTASAEALRRIQQEYLPEHYPDRRVLGVIVPAAEAAIEATKNKRVGVLATVGTVTSGTVANEVRKLDSSVELFQESAPLLVPLIEAGTHESEETKQALQSYLAPLLAEHIDTLILACTHYEHLIDDVRELVGPEIAVIAEGGIVADKLEGYLVRHPDLAATLSRGSAAVYLTTGDAEQFNVLGSRFMGESVSAENVTLT
ncbi:MAG TPA: glutamate racemase [Candidatus Paceibacterota bacterium]|nr:glutamate racemase [Candidatus Paceibacterota bacterium]